MKNDLKFPARYALMDTQEMSEVTGGAALGTTVANLITGVVSGCALVVTSLATAVVSLVDLFVSFVDNTIVKPLK